MVLCWRALMGRRSRQRLHCSFPSSLFPLHPCRHPTMKTSRGHRPSSLSRGQAISSDHTLERQSRHGGLVMTESGAKPVACRRPAAARLCSLSTTTMMMAALHRLRREATRRSAGVAPTTTAMMMATDQATTTTTTATLIRATRPESPKQSGPDAQPGVGASANAWPPQQKSRPQK